MSLFPILHLGDIVEMKKPHPCGSRLFKILRVGADIKIFCTKCERTMTFERTKVEKMIKKVVSVSENGEENL